MNFQFKWFRLDERYSTDTFLGISQVFSSRIFRLNSTNVLVSYDYGGAFDYKQILHTMNTFRASQKIITSSVFYDFLSILEQFDNLKVSDIQLLDCFDNQNGLIEKLVIDINNNVPASLTTLLTELKWLCSEGIDIKYISFDIMIEGLIYSFHIYSNGVIMIDDDIIMNEVKNFLNKGIGG